ncbi:molybdenum cofactor sulfurase 2-like [Toxorhynchites rutilus septentrionalis]|uniref:molybdenum cofactor sulfurase 2-like n=1 Tax=Toxorhynchites rutilus septentrionalis TaxID=329112 RepID=UPI00247951F8|nr:molybdenum cofactor sulfurase 2-like [Toxorhynchites rutilus septentrionalis]
MEFTQEYTAEEAANIEREFSRLKGKHYMDHAGATLYAESQIRAVQATLVGNLFCNPHTSRLTGELMDQVRQRVLRFFNTNASEYSLVFTSGATAGLKLVAESFTFRREDDPEGDEGAFVFLRDNHTSVLGMRAIVGTGRIHPLERDDFLRHARVSGRSAGVKPSLLVFPAQNNFNAAKYPLDLIEEVRLNGLLGYDDERFHVCLDAASYVSTNYLDLRRYRPDFVCISFYKIFGYPTGLGALLIRHGSEQLLQKKYYGGGTIKILLSGQNLHMKHDSLVERFEDGTQPFLSIISLLEGLNTIQRLIPLANGYRTMERVSLHVFNLAKYCYRRLGTLVHANGATAIRFYMDSRFETRDRQGGIVNFNVLRDDGSYVGFTEFAQVALTHGIYLRTGCFCNAGTCQRQLGLTDDEVLMFFKMGKVCGDDTDMIEGQPTGTVRASFGYMNKPQDVDRLVEMINKCFVRSRNIYSTPRVKTIYLHPVRSCGAFVVSTLWPLISEGGLKYDREFSIVDGGGNPLRIATPKIHPRIDPKSNTLILSHSGMHDLELDLNTVRPEPGDTSPAVDCGELPALWLSMALGIPKLRLVRHLNGNMKLLLINLDALKDLCDEDVADDELTKAWLVEHLQGNLIIDWRSQSKMETWKGITIGEHRFKVTGMCTRFPTINMSPMNDTVPKQSLKIIARMFTKKASPMGVYLTHVWHDKSNRALECDTEVEISTEPHDPKGVVMITQYTSKCELR